MQLLKKIISFRSLIFILFLLLIVGFLGRELNPFSQKIFNFHDITQFSRISEFTYNIKNLQIPPRIAPHFSFGFGYPVFNFYAPFAYWVTSAINLIGVGVISSLKLSFLLTVLVSFVFIYKFLRLFFPFHSSLLGAVLYSASPYFAVEIFVRGNLAETWFIALLPLTFYILYKNMQSSAASVFIFSVLILSFILTSHNALSIIFIPIVIVYMALIGKFKKNLIALLFALFFSSYFLLPFIVELPLTHAREVAKFTNYKDHFLCLRQLWSSPWGYAGSAPGCIVDGMSFMLGKAQIVLGLIGTLVFLHGLFFIKRSFTGVKVAFFILILGLGSIFMTTYWSSFIWNILSPFLSFLQFPWRFLIFGMFALAFFGAFAVSGKFTHLKIITLIITFFILFSGSEYFKGQYAKDQANDRYLNRTHIEREAAYFISEYLPLSADYSAWRKYNPATDDNISFTSIKDDGFTKEIKTTGKDIKLNIHYFPYWKITINNQLFMPTKFDSLGRPVIKTNRNPATILVKYEQTVVEKLANLLSLITIIFLIAFVSNKKIWTKVN